jgi:hypothetical protein
VKRRGGVGQVDFLDQHHPVCTMPWFLPHGLPDSQFIHASMTVPSETPDHRPDKKGLPSFCCRRRSGVLMWERVSQEQLFGSGNVMAQ